MRVRSLGFSTDLSVLRASGASVHDRGDHIVVRSSRNPGFWWGNFVLVGGPGRVARGVEVFRREFPSAAQVAIGVDGTHGPVPSPAGSHGLDPDVSVVLTAPSLPPPAGVDAEVRALSGAADWDDLFGLRRLEDPPGADASFQRARVADAARITGAGVGTFLGAFRDGQLVSTCGIVFDGRATARYQHVQTHPDHRRRGLAGHLVCAASADAARRWPLERLVIVADPQGPAIGLYQALGFRTAELQVHLTGPAAAPAAG